MTDKTLSAKDKQFIHRYGLSCWAKAVQLEPVKLDRPHPLGEKMQSTSENEKHINNHLPRPYGWGADK